MTIRIEGGSCYGNESLRASRLDSLGLLLTMPQKLVQEAVARLLLGQEPGKELMVLALSLLWDLRSVSELSSRCWVWPTV